MRIIIDIKETEAGDVLYQMQEEGRPKSSLREDLHATAIQNVLRREIPKLSKELGATGVVTGKGRFGSNSN